MEGESYFVSSCESCGRKHPAARLIKDGGVRYYWCPVTENKVVLSIEPLEPA